MNDIEKTTLKKEFNNDSSVSLFCKLQESLTITDFSFIKDWFDNDKKIFKIQCKNYIVLYFKNYACGIFIYDNKIEFNRGFIMCQCHTR